MLIQHALLLLNLEKEIAELGANLVVYVHVSLKEDAPLPSLLLQASYTEVTCSSPAIGSLQRDLVGMTTGRPIMVPTDWIGPAHDD